MGQSVWVGKVRMARVSSGGVFLLPRDHPILNWLSTTIPLYVCMKLCMNPLRVLLVVQILFRVCSREPDLKIRLTWSVAYPGVLAAWLWFLKASVLLAAGRYPAPTLSRPMKKLPSSALRPLANMLSVDLLQPVPSVCTFLISMATLGVASASSRVPLMKMRLVGRARFPLMQPWKLLIIGLRIENVLMLARLLDVLACFGAKGIMMLILVPWVVRLIVV